MVDDGDILAVFNSTHRVLQAERLLKEQKLAFLLIPAPRALATDCGLALRYAASERPAIEGALAAAGLSPVELYQKTGEEFQRLA